MKTYSLEELTDQYIGRKGDPKRDEFDRELRIDLLGEVVRRTRKERNLTQEELGDLVGVKKNQISKIENNTIDARLETVVKVFEVLGAKIHFYVEVDNQPMVY